jgi:Predicted CoA-binding protein
MSASGTDETDSIVEHILRTYDAITVVGASNASHKAAHYVPQHMQAHGWRIIPVNPTATRILGESVYPSLADVPEQVGLVDVFRPSESTPGSCWPPESKPGCRNVSSRPAPARPARQSPRTSAVRRSRACRPCCACSAPRGCDSS